MSDKYPIEDVLELEVPQSKARAVSQSQVTIAPLKEDDGKRILDASIALVPKTESLLQEWFESVLSECLVRHNHFRDVAGTCPTEAEWNCVFNGVQLALLSGDADQSRLDEMGAWLVDCPLAGAKGIRSTLAFFGHQPKLAIELYESAYLSKGDAGSSEFSPALPSGLSAVVYALSLVQQTTQNVSSDSAGEFSAADLELLQKLIARLSAFSGHYQRQFAGDVFLPVLHVLTDFVRVVAKTREIKDTFWLGGVHIDASAWLDLFMCLIHHWLGDKPDEAQVARLATHVDAASVAGLHWFVDEGLTLLSACGMSRESCEFQPQIRSTGWLLTVFQRQADWQAGLDALSLTVNRHARVANESSLKAETRRLTWWVEVEGSRLLVEPREQRLERNKRWSRGKHFPLKLLLDECGTLDFLCDYDLKICVHLRNQLQLNHALHFEKNFTFSDAESLELIVNHPRLFRQDSDEDLEDPEDVEDPVRITMLECQSTLQVIADRSQQEINIVMEPFPSTAITSSSDFSCEWKEDNVLAISRYTEGQLDIARALSYSGLNVPDDAAESVLESLREMAALVEIHSDINTVDTNTVVASRRVAFHLRPLDSGLDIAACLYPLGENGPCVLPGQGRPGLYAMIGNQPCNTTRDLEAELTEARELLSTLPLPEELDQESVAWQWSVADAEPALELLAALQAHNEKVALMWPAGESILLSQVIDSDNMNIHFNANANGIGVAGELKIEEGDQHLAHTSYGATAQCAFASKKIDLKKLLASLDAAEGRFLRLDDGKILQLSRRLRMQLDVLNSLCDDATAHHLMVPVLAEVSRGMVLRDDDSWDEQLGKLHEAEALMPDTPATLQAELRDYQLEGFRWMARLAHWGAGACLADDMGLGKTMQSLSLMLMRAEGGPSLVVAPTSVCGNWLAEAAKFAPSLRLHWLGDGDRRKMLLGATAGDLFVCSYGVLQNEIELLQEIEFHTIVADEAQSFKNPGTRRSQAMMSLCGDFRMAATGTPIENHLGELWNLFRFINPGLLGSARQFKDRYSIPIEQNQDEMARHRLKTLIKPFILRRLKSEVLTELPPRTEITHLVEFNEEEKSFYDSLRLSALQRISELTDLDSEQRFRVLAEITTLRQACCHPMLVEENPPCGSAKLRAFAQIVDELRHNGHRCLVFSQFVGHLTLIRNHLDSKNISYQYLDGSTSVKNRKKAVDDFQDGQGELFLISLKAGGSGLNLTEADYVIHMDPWWNPAVEDQASDRAYRMGQKRPVTIYRMVVKDTIEEKIVKLHEHKRDLANALLEGTDGGSTLSVDELVGLIDDECEENNEVA